MAGGTAGLMAIGAIDARLVEPTWLDVTHPQVFLPNLPPAWDGVRIALWADIHSGWLLTWKYLERVVAASNAESPDMLLFCGDMIGHDEPGNTRFVDLLSRLTCRDGSPGKLACLGNHDHRSAMQHALNDAGIATLVNDHRILTRSGQPLCIAGVDDLWSGEPSLRQALRGVREDIPRILLCHNPDFAEQMPPGQRVDLMLSGHTHGGQIRIPLLGPLITATRHRRYAAGWAQGPCCQVYTTRGIGMSILPFRFNCRPELPIITLRRA